MSPGNETPSPAVRLDAEIQAWQALLGLLREEEQALAEGDAGRLETLTPAKLKQLQVLGDHARARLDGLVAAGHTPDHAGMEAWLAQRGEPALRARWQQLREMEQAAQAANGRIGVLIDMRLASTRQALNVLLHAATRQGGLYDEAGQAVAARAGKPLTAA
jgi:flagella synthesis protein FlgN